MKLVLSLIAVLAVGLSTGCSMFKLDGKVGGIVPVSALEAPLNAAGVPYGLSGAGTAVASIDKAIVAQYNPAVRPYEQLSVTTNYYDSRNTEVYPPLRKVETPVFAPRVTQLSTGQPAQAPVVVDPAMLTQALALLQAARAESAPLIPAAVVPFTTSPAPASVDAELQTPLDTLNDNPQLPAE